MASGREDILRAVREALGRRAGDEAAPLPPTARVAPRPAGQVRAELDQFCAEVRKLSGVAERLAGPEAISAALGALVEAEKVTRATLWHTPELIDWGVGETLAALGVEIVSPQADLRAVAACELGVTGADVVLAETGTLVLGSSPERPRVVSLLPRVHLAIARAAALRPDLHEALAAVRNDPYAVFVTGPSRTADIELTLTRGVHGPAEVHAIFVEQAIRG